MIWMKKLRDGAILVLVFIVAVIGFSYYTNKGNDNMTADMGAATFPQISFSYNGYVVNTLSGFIREMDITAMRDTITPVDAGRVEGTIQAYENKIKKADYTVYSLDGKEKLREGELDRNGENFTLQLDGMVAEGAEWVLEIVLNTGGDRNVYFYTRIADASEVSLGESLDYIRSFHDNAMNKVEGAGIGTPLAWLTCSRALSHSMPGENRSITAQSKKVVPASCWNPHTNFKILKTMWVFTAH